MKILEKLFILFLFTFPTGVLARIELSNGVALTLNDLVLAVLVISWIILKFNLKKIKQYFLFKPLALFCAVGLVSLLINFPQLGLIKFLISGSYLVRFVSYTLLYFIVKDFSKDFKVKINKYMFASGLIVVLLGYFQYFFFPSLKPLFKFGWDEHLYRMTSVFLDPNFAGTFFNIFFIFSLDILRKHYKTFSKIKNSIYLLISILSFFAVYLTYSRSALMMLFVSVVVYLFLIGKKKLIFISILFLILMIFVSPRAFQTEGTDLLRVVSTTERFSSLNIALKVIQDNPILGVGFNAYRYAQAKVGLYGIFWQVTHSGAGTDASLLFVIATTGFLGFFVYLYMLFKTFVLAKINFKSSGIVLFVVLAGLLIDSLFINSLFYVFILEWLFILIGLTEGSN